MELKIYSQSGGLKLAASTSSSSTWNRELMTENAVSASFTHPFYVPLDVNDYVMLEGVKFSVKKEYKPKQKDRQTYSYSVKFYAPIHDAEQVMYLHLTDGEYNPQFSLDGSPREHLQKWVENMNRIYGKEVWSIGDVVVADNRTIEYNNVTCWDAATQIAEAFGTEWWADGFTFNLSRCERGERVELGYMQGLTSLVQSENSDDVKFFTRLIPLGSARNIDASRYGFSRLQLPDRAKYVDRNTHYGLYEHVEEEAFTEIFPHYTGTVTSVRPEEKTGEDKKPFTVYYFKDSGLAFDPCENEIAGLVKHVSFQTGDLAGRDFEANYHSTTKEWEIINTYPSDDVQIPGGNLIPAVGNEYIPWNFRMPVEYETRAELDYKAAVDDYLAKYSDDVSKYGGDTDYTYIDRNAVPLLPGQRVRLLSDKYFSASGGYRDTRMTKVVRKLDNLGIATVECTDQVGKGWKSQVTSSLNQLKYVVDEKKETIFDILKTWDTKEPGNYSVFSSLRSRAEHLSRKYPDIASEVITFLKGLLVGGNGSGITVLENGMSQAVVDYLYVKAKAVFDELEVKKKTSIGGEQILSPAGMKCIRVEEQDDVYRCYFKAEEDGIEIDNQFTPGTLAMSQECNIKTGMSRHAGSRYYWRLVTAAGSDYIDLSKADCDPNAENDVPAAGDDIVGLGHATDITRQGAIVLSSVNEVSPAILMYQGIDDFTLAGREVIGFDFDKATGNARMRVYGDAYIGDKEGKSYMKYDPQTGLEIKGQLAVGSRIGDGRTVENAFKSAEDGIVAAQNKAEEAKKSAGDALTAIGGYDYLKQALKGGTVFQGGLGLTSTMLLGQTLDNSFIVKSGINGLYDATKPGGGISSWAGGPMKDLAEDYPLPWASTPQPANPELYAKSVTRMDGTGYDVGGNFWKTGDGKIHCDPLSFFVGEEKVGDILSLFTPVKKNGTLVGALQNVPFEDGTGKGLVMFGKHTLREDADGNVLFENSDGTPVNLLITGSVTMNALGSRPAATVMDGVIVDGTTITKQDGKLVAIGGGGSSVDMTAVWDALAANTTEQINVSHIPSLDWSKIGSGKPTTLAGYGITDGLTASAGVKKSGDVMTGQLDIRYGHRLLLGDGNINSYGVSDNGWDRGLSFVTSDGSVLLGKFGVYGSSDALHYLYVGSSYDGSVNTWQSWASDKSIVRVPFEAPNFLAQGDGVYAGHTLYLPYDAVSYGATVRPRIGRFDRGAGATVLQLGTANTFEIIDKNWSYDIITVEGGTTNPFKVRGNNSSGQYIQIGDGSATGAEVGWYTGLGAYLQNDRLGSYPTLSLGGVDSLADGLRFGYNNTYYKVWHTGNDRNILERSGSGEASSGTATGWFRIGQTYNSDAGGSAFTLYLYRNYSYANNEAYTFDISVTYSGKISIVQTSGYANTRLIDKIRVTGNSNSGPMYVDIHIATSTANNYYTWLAVGPFETYSTWTANPSTNSVYVEFATNNGVKSDYGFVGNLNGTSWLTDTVNVHDIRSTNYTPNVAAKDYSIYAWFNNTGTPDNNWWSGITVKGWGDSYAVWQLCGLSTTNATNQHLYVRNGIGTTWNSWNTLAFMSDNVASATKLHTARTIWNQPFDGTSNVSGNMMGVGGIWMSGYINSRFLVSEQSDESRLLFNGVHTVTFGGIHEGYAHRSYHFRPAVSDAGYTNCTVYIQNGGPSLEYYTTHLFDQYGNATHTGTLQASNISANGGLLQSTSNGNTVTIGSQNNSYCHIYNSANIDFIFNKSVWVIGQILPYNGNYNIGSSASRWGEVYATGWFRSTSGRMLYDDTYGGGIYMSDSTWVQTYNKAFLCRYTAAIGSNGFNVNIKAESAGHAGIEVSSGSYTMGLGCHSNGSWYWWRGTAAGKGYCMQYNGSTWDFTGNIIATGGVTMNYTSDLTLKQNIRLVTDASKRLMSLGGIYDFAYIDEEVQKNPTYAGEHIGLIYQNVKDTSMSRMCHQRKDGKGTINYIEPGFISLLAAVGMEHETRLQKLERENRTLKRRINILERRLA